jgi:peroxiredoxin
MGRLQALGVTVLGVSPDNPASHRKFAQKFDLPYPLLADPDKKVADAYGVWAEKSMYGRTYMGVERSTFVIDNAGVVRKAFRKVKVGGHVDEVIAAIQAVAGG